MRTKLYHWIIFAIGILAVYLLNTQAHAFYEFAHHHASEPHLSGLTTFCIVMALSFGLYHFSKNIPIPSFVVAIGFGLAARSFLAPVVDNQTLLSGIVSAGAALILFGGGLETPWENFKRLIPKIASLSFIGLGITALLYSLALLALAPILGFSVSVAAAILLGAILASTDPASIIPVLNQFKFKNRDIRDIIVSESAVTDVTGTILTVVFLSILKLGGVFTSITQGYQQLLTLSTATFLLQQLGLGVLMGIVGWLILELFGKFAKKQEREHEVDAQFLLFVPLLIFLATVFLGGSGYLAGFIAGLLFRLTEHLHHSEKYFNITIEGWVKPVIFLLLGALIDPAQLIEYAPIGILSALVFMFIIRPIAVWTSLYFFRMSWRELAFISFVRETGAIPAVLLVQTYISGVSGLEGLVPIGMWVILATLVIEPILTPSVGKKLQVGTLIETQSVSA